MHAVLLKRFPHMGAMAGSVAVHAFVAAWFLSSATRLEIMPQEMIKVMLVALPMAEPVAEPMAEPVAAPIKPKPTPAPPATPLAKVQNHEVKKPKALPRAIATEQTKALPAAQATSSETSAASEAGAGPAEAVPTASSKPLFDAAYLNNPAPEYPAHAKRRRMEGTVMLDVAVNTAGAAYNVRIAESSGFTLLDESAKTAVSRWKFIPAKRGGETVEARVIVPIEFRLE